MNRIFTLLIALCSLNALHAQQYQPVEEKSAVKFSIKNFGINTGGEFKGLEGAIDFDKASPEKAQFNISVDAAKVNTDNSSRDSHLRKAEYFDVAKYPKISFKSEKVIAKKGAFSMSGTLTIKGKTRNVTIPFTAEAKDDGLLFEGSFDINRRDFEVGGGSLVLGDNVTVKLSVFAKKK